MDRNPTRLRDVRDLVLGGCLIVILAGSSILTPERSVLQAVIDVVWTVFYAYGTIRVLRSIRDDVEEFYGWSLSTVLTVILLLALWWVFALYIVQGWL